MEKAKQELAQTSPSRYPNAAPSAPPPGTPTTRPCTTTTTIQLLQLLHSSALIILTRRLRPGKEHVVERAPPKIYGHDEPEISTPAPRVSEIMRARWLVDLRERRGPAACRGRQTDILGRRERGGVECPGERSGVFLSASSLFAVCSVR